MISGTQYHSLNHTLQKKKKVLLKQRWHIALNREYKLCLKYNASIEDSDTNKPFKEECIRKASL